MIKNKLLVKTTQKCSELIHILTKIQKWGLHSYHPDTKKTNLRSLTEEVGDVFACLELLLETNEIDKELLEQRIKQKKRFIRDFISE